MGVVPLNQRQPASRLGVGEATLERCGSEGIGPKFLKPYDRVLDRPVEITACEESCLATSSKTVEAQTRARRRMLGIVGRSGQVTT
jgi:hypothetical protein